MEEELRRLAEAACRAGDRLREAAVFWAALSSAAPSCPEEPAGLRGLLDQTRAAAGRELADAARAATAADDAYYRVEGRRVAAEEAEMDEWRRRGGAGVR